MRTTTTSYSIGPRTSYFFHVFNLSYKSRGPGQAKPEPSCGWWLWPGLGFQKAKAVPGQAKAPAFRPSRARTTLAALSIVDGINLPTSTAAGHGQYLKCAKRSGYIANSSRY